MNTILDHIEPSNVMHYFQAICDIPHVSYHTEKISAYIQKFAEEQGLRYYADEAGNVVIYKDATVGYENHPTVILQGHTDMVGAKTADSAHDFENDSLTLDPNALKEGFISAINTTLGGDDGIAVAYMMAILSDRNLKHPALECVFTVDEEVGLLGASALDMSVLSGKVMINLDSEDEGIFTTGSAGGMHMDCSVPMQYTNEDVKVYKLTISGLLGGHSGVSIGTGRPSAIVLLGRLLYTLDQHINLRLVDLYAGEVDNAIANLADAYITFDPSDLEVVTEICAQVQNELAIEYRGIENNITIQCSFDSQGVTEVCNEVSTQKVICFLRNAPYGVQNRNASDINLVETSLNPGVLRLEDELFVGYSIRSSIESAKHDLAAKLSYLTEFLGGTVDEGGDYPGWAYDPDSKLRPLVGEVYEEVTGKKPVFVTIHAGLECGLFYGGMNGDLDIISYGPDMHDIHTFDEKLDIASVKRTYELTVRLLEKL